MVAVTLKTVVDMQIGYQARSRIRESVHGTHRLIQSKDFDSHHNLQADHLAVFIPERKPEIYAVRKGDILFQARGVSHFACCVEDDLIDTLASASFYILRTKNENLLPPYLAWWLNQPQAQAWLQSQAGGTGISFISKSTLSRLQIRIPALLVQKKVLKVVTLSRREQFLLDKLAVARSRLVSSVCINAIQEQER